MAVLFFAALLGIIPAMIASKKGRNAFAWWLYGAVIFIIALPHALLLNASLKPGERKCPYCAEFIKAEAKVCRFCGKDLPELVAGKWGSKEEYEIWKKKQG